jgi:phage shock protein A
MNEYLSQILSFLSGGFVSAIVNRFFLTKKEQNDYALQLITALQTEVTRLSNEMATLRKDYQQLEYEYEQIKEKYNELKQKN